MAIFCALSLFVGVFFAIVGISLAFAWRDERRAMLAALEAMQHRVRGQDEQIAILPRALPDPSARRLIEVTGDRLESPRSLAVKVGTEVLVLDAETVARIDALKEDVNVGRYTGTLLQDVLEAGFNAVEEDAPTSEEKPLCARAPGDRESDE